MIGTLRGLPGLRWDELLAPAIPAPVDVNPTTIEIDGGNIERQQLPEPYARVDGEPQRGAVLRPHRGDQLWSAWSPME